MGDDAPVFRIPLPERTDRRLRLGPFPSVGQALKFAAYAGVGAAAASALGPVGWLPFLAGGFVCATYRPGGVAPDEQLALALAYRLRNGPVELHPRSLGAWVSGDSLRTAAGVEVAAIVAGGIPVAFLPPRESRRLFDRFRQLLAEVEGSLWIVVRRLPVDPRRFRPVAELVPGSAPDSTARRGYDELLQALLRRRARRRITLFLSVAASEPPSRERLSRAVGALLDGLAQLEVPAERLVHQALVAEGRSLGLVGRSR